MFFRRTDRKRHGACFILAVGALATVGAISVIRYGKQVMKGTGSKIKSFLKKDSCMCMSGDEGCE